MSFNATLPALYPWQWEARASCTRCHSPIYMHQQCHAAWVQAGSPALDCSQGHRARGPVCEAVGLKIAPGAKQSICTWALWEVENTFDDYALIPYTWKPGLEPEWLCRACNTPCQSLERPRACPNCGEVSPR